LTLAPRKNSQSNQAFFAFFFFSDTPLEKMLRWN
jgi:hypothetical protein